MPDENSEKIGREEIKQYLKDLKNGTRKEKAIAAYMLGTVGKKNRSVKKALKNALDDENWEVRKWAALSLGEMGEKNSKLVPILINVLQRDDSKEFRSHAAIILGELEKRAVSAIPALGNAVQDKNTRVKQWANWAIHRIAGTSISNPPKYPDERPSLEDRLRFAEKELEKD